MARLRGVGALVAATLIALSGCSGGGDLVVQRAGGTVLLALAEDPDASMLANMGGTLTRTDRGCLALGGGGAATTLVFPHGTTLAADGQRVTIPNRGVVRIGGKLRGGGGYGSLSSQQGVPDECQVGTDVAILN